MSSFLKKFISTQKTKIRCGPRVKIIDAHNTKVVVNHTKKNKELAVDNLSLKGMGLLLVQDGNELEKKIDYKNSLLHIQDKVFALDFKIVHQNRDRIFGCEFIHIEETYYPFWDRFFHHELRALSITYITADKLHITVDGTPHWFYGGEDYELFIVEKQKRITLFRLKLFDHYLEYELETGLRYAKIFEGKSPGDIKYKPSTLLMMENIISDEIKILGLKFIYNIKELPSVYRKQIETILQGHLTV